MLGNPQNLLNKENRRVLLSLWNIFNKIYQESLSYKDDELWIISEEFLIDTFNSLDSLMKNTVKDTYRADIKLGDKYAGMRGKKPDIQLSYSFGINKVSGDTKTLSVEWAWWVAKDTRFKNLKEFVTLFKELQWILFNHFSAYLETSEKLWLDLKSYLAENGNLSFEITEQRFNSKLKGGVGNE